MNWRKGLVTSVLALALVVTGLLAACTEQPITLDGRLYSIDSAGGKVYVVTEEGRLAAFDMDADTQVQLEGEEVSAETVPPGVHVKVKATGEDGVARIIEVFIAQAKGPLIALEGDKLTLVSESAQRIEVRVTQDTIIEFDDRPATLAAFQIGGTIAVSYDPKAGVAYKIEGEKEIKTQPAPVATEES